MKENNNDPLDQTRRKFQFQKQPSEYQVESFQTNQEIQHQNKIRNTVQTTNNSTQNIDSNAVRKARLEENLKFLQGSVFENDIKFTNLGKEFESDLIGQEVTGLFYHYEKQKMAMAQRQIQEERTLIQELNQKIEQNIAKFVNLESRLKHKQEELETEVRIKSQKLIESERLAAIGDLSSRLAHDLKNPLSVLKMFTDILKMKSKDDQDPTFRNKLEAANAAIYRISHQVDNVLDYVRISPIQKEDTTIHDIIDLALLRLPNINQISLNIEQQNLDLYCDKAKMVIVFVNILLNSIQAIPSRGNIAIKCSRNEQNTTIEITDSGIGMSNDVLPKVFDPLFTTKQNGTGLGLATCKNIVERHGGKIYAKNNPTTFTVILPNKSSDKQEGGL